MVLSLTWDWLRILSQAAHLDGLELVMAAPTLEPVAPMEPEPIAHLPVATEEATTVPALSPLPSEPMTPPNVEPMIPPKIIETADAQAGGSPPEAHTPAETYTASEASSGDRE
jgi:hypothetical protein